MVMFIRYNVAGENIRREIDFNYSEEDYHVRFRKINKSTGASEIIWKI